MRAHKRFTLQIGTSVYSATKQVVDNTIQLAKDKYIAESTNAIVAIEREGIISMRRDTFPGVESLDKQVSEYSKQGFTVHYVSIKN